MKRQRKTIKETCLVEIKKGNNIQEKIGLKRTGRLIDFRLVPNSMNDPSLICVLIVDTDGGKRIISSASNWQALDNVLYKECFNSDLLNVNEIIEEEEDFTVPDGEN